MKFNFKKKFGQNFISDKNLLKSICEDAEICSEDEVLEIGAGMGALTKEISEHAKKVVAYEIDEELKPYLQSIELKNLILHFEDALKKPILDIEKDFENGYKLVANLPYYITSPLIFKFLQSTKIQSITIMVQKEVGERIVAKCGNKNYGSLSVCCQYFGQPKIMRKVPKTVFNPQPDVDSCIVRLDIENKFDESVDKLFKLVRICFKSRRKTVLNNLAEGLNLNKTTIAKLSFDLNQRAEQLSVQQFIVLEKLLHNYLGQDVKVPIEQ